MGQSSEMMEMINRRVNIRRLIRSVDFPDESVGQAAKDQPKLFLKAARFRAQKLREKLTAESNLEQAKAYAGAKIREQIISDGKRDTAPAIQEQLIRDQRIKTLEKEFHDALAIEEYAKLLVETYRQRKSSIEAVIDLMGAELYVQRRAGEGGELATLKKNLEKKYPGRLTPGRDGQDD